MLFITDGNCRTACIGRAKRVAVSGDYAYVPDHYNGLMIVDISNPSSPALKGSYDTPGNAQGVAISGNYAYIADGNDLVIVDISNPSSPIPIRNYNTGGWAQDIAVSGNYAYVIDYANGIFIVDISNPSSPLLKGIHATSPIIWNGDYGYGGCIKSVAVSGNYAYVADEGNGLLIVDVSNASSPVLKGSYPAAEYAFDVAVSGNYAYVVNSNNGLAIIDISDPSSPVLNGSYNPERHVEEVAVSGNYAYLVVDNSLVIIDISNPSSPVLKGRYVGSVFDIAVSGSYVYVGGGVNGLVILKANPEQPAFIFADFSSNVTSGYAPLSVRFNDSSQNTTAWNWDFGDGFNSTNQNPVHTYSSAGTYTVNLKVSNANKTASKEATIFVMKTNSPGENSSNGSEGIDCDGAISTKGTNDPAKGSKKTPGFEIVSGGVSLLAAFWIKESNKKHQLNEKMLVVSSDHI
ncbi:PKD domain-containing protein [Methanosarcina sp. 1.H.A.2.2]|uniref:PKD domain-containing protein n=1 Tax=Methanosarcina sp. 1.H.A.2.2 TaxID=1483601 RepID=UPI001F162E78|nr:PKD domain-containing protein [Methanosarcina sp. 1.H.A.2.2]